jgi:hypothetical protein
LIVKRNMKKCGRGRSSSAGCNIQTGSVFVKGSAVMRQDSMFFL